MRGGLEQERPGGIETYGTGTGVEGNEGKSHSAMPPTATQPAVPPAGSGSTNHCSCRCAG